MPRPHYNTSILICVIALTSRAKARGIKFYLPKSTNGCIIACVKQELIGGYPLANTHAAEKAIRQSARRQVRNRVIRTTTRTQIKKATTVIAAGDAAAAEKATLEALSALDRAAQKGIIKKNNAARRKSRLMKKLNQLRADKK